MLDYIVSYIVIVYFGIERRKALKYNHSHSRNNNNTDTTNNSSNSNTTMK